MTLTLAIALNIVLGVAILAMLAYVCWIPFRSAFSARPELSPATEADRQPASERFAA